LEVDAFAHLRRMNPMTKQHLLIARHVAEHPDITYEKIATFFGVSRDTVIRVARKARITRSRGRKLTSLSPQGTAARAQRDFQALEERRLLAAPLLRRGVPHSEVALQVGVRRQSVSRWAQQLEAGGLSSLKKAGRLGRKPRLGPEDFKKIERGLRLGPQALGYETGRWTVKSAAHLIEKECGIRYHPSRAWRILQQLGWSGRSSDSAR
jgi:transposase